MRPDTNVNVNVKDWDALTWSKHRSASGIRYFDAKIGDGRFYRVYLDGRWYVAYLCAGFKANGITPDITERVGYAANWEGVLRQVRRYHEKNIVPPPPAPPKPPEPNRWERLSDWRPADVQMPYKD